MGIVRLPRVEFVSERLTGRSARQEFVTLLEKHLCGNFGEIKVFRKLFPGMSFLALSVNGEKFSIGIAKQRWKGYTEVGWRVVVDPLDRPFPKSVTNGDEKRYGPGLLRISVAIHYLITVALGVTKVRWFFEGWDVLEPTVRSPEKLPWHMSKLEK